MQANYYSSVYKNWLGLWWHFGFEGAFAALALERFTADSPQAFTLQKPFAYNGVMEFLQRRQKSDERGWRHPVRFVEECGLCGDCESECPTQAFDAGTGLSDPLKCIECMHCVYICPEQALKVDDRMKDVYEDFLEDWHLTEEMMDQKKSKIITAAWQAAF